MRAPGSAARTRRYSDRRSKSAQLESKSNRVQTHTWPVPFYTSRIAFLSRTAARDHVRAHGTMPRSGATLVEMAAQPKSRVASSSPTRHWILRQVGPPSKTSRWRAIFGSRSDVERPRQPSHRYRARASGFFSLARKPVTGRSINPVMSEFLLPIEKRRALREAREMDSHPSANPSRVSDLPSDTVRSPTNGGVLELALASRRNTRPHYPPKKPSARTDHSGALS